MIFKGTLTSVGSSRVVDGQYGSTTYNTILVEKPTITGRRIGMAFSCRSPYAEKVQELYSKCVATGFMPTVEVQFEPTVRDYEKDGQKKTITENVVLNIVHVG